MQLYRFTHDGRVCAGDYLDDQGKGIFAMAKESENEHYLIIQGYFILIMIIVYYSMIGLSILSIIVVALTLKYQKQENDRASVAQ